MADCKKDSPDAIELFKQGVFFGISILVMLSSKQREEK